MSTGGVTTDGGTGAGGTSGDPFQGVISAFCATARTCCAQAGLPTSALADCEAKFATRRPVITLVALGQASINTTALAACEAAYRQAASTCTTGQVLAACTGILVGLQAENQPCGKGGNPSVPGASACKQTGGPEVCVWTAPDTSDPSVAGVCKKMVHGKLGDTCGSTCELGQDCSSELLTSPGDTDVTWCFEEDGLYCSYQNTPSSCASLTAVGANCAADSEACGSANYCDSNSVCRARAPLGQACMTTPCARPYACSVSDKCEEYNPPFADPDFSCQGYAPELF